MDLAGRKVGVMGLGLSGEAAARFLLARGARVVASESRDEASLGGVAARLRAAGAAVETGGHGPRVFEGCEAVVVSPGVPPRLEPLEAARRAGAEVISEIELACRFLKGRVIGVTGSNGKSTVTALTAAILAAAGFRARPCGNIGLPLISMMDETPSRIPVKDLGREEATGGDAPDALFVAEISSFQLEGIREFRPAAAALLNLSPDHQDRYDRPDDYYAAKARIFMNQGPGDVAVLNADDPGTWALAGAVRARLVPFSIDAPAGEGVRLRGGRLVHAAGAAVEDLLDASEIPLPGRHNLENVAASAALAISMGADPGAVRRAVKAFRALPHRLRFVRMIGGASVYDDSKATNVGSTLRAVESFASPIVLLLGGRDKGGDFPSLVPGLKGRVRAVVTFGEAGPAIADRLEGALPVVRGGALATAAAAAIEAARPGDVVLLAPACASFDAYSGYAARGDDFVRIVEAIAASRGEA